MIIKIGDPLTPAQDKVLRTAIDISEAGENMGFDSLPSVILHELYKAVSELKREPKMGSHKFGEGRIEDGLGPDIACRAGSQTPAENLSTSLADEP